MNREPVIKPIRIWHIVIGGFMQNEGRPTGMVRLWRLLDAEHAQPGVRVELRNWNENWRQFAELIWRVRPGSNHTVVNVYAYSWGAGWGAMQLAKQLARRGVQVSQMVLSDPVYRSPWLLLRWLALTSRPRIKVPQNVGKVTWYRQTRNRPRGHQLLAADPDSTTIHPPYGFVTDVAHEYMDDLREFHHTCRMIARQA